MVYVSIKESYSPLNVDDLKRGVPNIMSSVPYFAEIVQFMHITTSCRLSVHWLVTQVNISFTCLLASVQCTSFHSLFVRLCTK